MNGRKAVVSVSTKPTPKLQPPAEAPADAIERVSPRRQTIVSGDVVVSREPLPLVNPTPIFKETQWRYRVCIEGQPGSSQFFDGFAAASARAEDLATRYPARIMFVEEGVVSLLADYRRRR